MSFKILIVEDEKNISDIIKFNLEKEGYEVLCAYNGEDGYNTFLNNEVDLILLDIMMPKLDGIEVCKKVRETSQVPVIMLTAKAEELDKVLGFEVGADDYVTKPFSNKELMARVKANLRRTANTSNNSETAKGEIINIGELTINLDKYEIFKRGEALLLTKREFDLVVFFVTQKEQIFSREDLLEKVWGYDYFGDVRTVDVTIRRLRIKLEDDSEKPQYILTKRGVGYYFGG